MTGAALLSGCFTGERPYLTEGTVLAPGGMSGDPAIDAVLQRFDAPSSGPLTATYKVLTKYGNTTNPAVVVLDPGKRSITVGVTRFIQTETFAATCTLDGTIPCVDGFDAKRISDTLLTVDFYAADAAKRLRRDAQAKIGPAVARTDVMASAPVTCVDVPVSGGTAVYCALESGLVALIDDGDVRVSLDAYGAAVDPAAFSLPG
jgi:hypothetical protein